MNRVFIIGGRSYNVSDPTIEKLSLAGKPLLSTKNSQIVL